jgi:hypothetical protein
VGESGQRGGADPGIPLRDEPDDPLAQRRVGGEDRQSVQGLPAHHVVGRCQLGCRGRRPPWIADRAEGAQREEGHGRVGVASEGEQHVDRRSVRERAEAPRGEGA